MTDILNPTARADSLSDRVAEEIRALLGRRRMPQAELARQLGVSGAWLNYRLTGRQPIDLNDLQQIANVLNVDVGSLLPAGLGGSTRGSDKANRRRNRRDAHTPSVLGVTIPGGRIRSQASRPPSYPHGARRPMVLTESAA